MATFADLKSEIATDLNRTDLTTQIDQAVKDAVQYHAAERFWFNETRDYTLSTVAGTSDYTLSTVSGVTDFIKVDYVQVAISSTNKFMLDRVSPEEMEDLLSVTTSAQPSYWSYYNSTFRFYPIPDAVYTIRIAGHCVLTALSGASDSNAWTTHARNLIRAAARKFVFARNIRNMPLAQISEVDEGRELDRLRRETSRRSGTRRIKAWM
jgi:hypothetical protein